MKLHGLRGSVEFDGAFVRVSKGMTGTHTIPLSAITGVNVGPVSFLIRAIRFETAGSSGQPKFFRGAQAMRDPSALRFNAWNRGKFQHLADEVMRASLSRDRY